MTADEIALRMVATFNAIDEKTIQFQAHNVDDITVIFAERNDFGVFTFAKDEREEPFDSGDSCKRSRVIGVIVNGPITDQRKKAHYMKAVEQLRGALEGVNFDRMNWDGNETVSLVDVDALRKGRFFAEFNANYSQFS
jgi:hypothetical protein